MRMALKEKIADISKGLVLVYIKMKQKYGEAGIGTLFWLP